MSSGPRRGEHPLGLDPAACPELELERRLGREHLETAERRRARALGRREQRRSLGRIDEVVDEAHALERSLVDRELAARDPFGPRRRRVDENVEPANRSCWPFSSMRDSQRSAGSMPAMASIRYVGRA